MKTVRHTKTIRCAIYTRKSTEHGLELEFNSLQAQREACQAYVKSQAHEGWVALATEYDDAAYSGGTLERPALQRLLNDIDAGKVDVIVVYKIDRLTRSLADFAKLVEQFDAKSISFVAITQQFNTTTSMGRLTLNVLLSFAQFERELSSERVRDKIAASRRKGKWTGGSVPIGYDAIDKKLVANQVEEKNVRYIFKRYMELGTIKLLESDLRTKNIRSKGRVNSKKQVTGGVPWTFGPLAYLLRNRIYIGEIGHKKKWYSAEHKAIVDRKTFDQVQQRLTANSVTRKVRRAESDALLMGLIFDDRGNRMSPSFSTKNGVRYRFYVSSALLRGTKAEHGSLPRVSATDVEEAVIAAARKHLSLEVKAPDRQVIHDHIETIIVAKQKLTIQFKMPSLSDADPRLGEIERSAGREPFTVSVPFVPSNSRPLIELDERAITTRREPDLALVQALGRAHYWLQELSSGTHDCIDSLAKANNIHPKVVRYAIRLAFIPPSVTADILTGQQSHGLYVHDLDKFACLSWASQCHTPRQSKIVN